MSSAVNWKNVNNWHWVEKDITEDVRSFFIRLENKPLGGGFTITRVTNFEGDATVNNRKGKAIPVLDFSLSIQVSNDSGLCQDIPILADSAMNSEIFEFGVKNLGADIVAACQVLFDDFRAHLKSLVESYFSTTSHATLSKAEQAPAKQNTPPNTERFAKASVTYSWSTNVPAAVIFDAIQAKQATPPFIKIIGDVFQISGGLIAYKIITRGVDSMQLEWKLRDWSSPSSVRLSSSTDDNDLTVLTVVQEKIPDDFLHGARRNWEEFVWRPLAMFFGFSFQWVD